MTTSHVTAPNINNWENDAQPAALSFWQNSAMGAEMKSEAPWRFKLPQRFACYPERVCLFHMSQVAVHIVESVSQDPRLSARVVLLANLGQGVCETPAGGIVQGVAVAVQ
jgi:hypothetical protein